MNDLIKEFARQSGFKVNWQHEDVQAIKMAQYREFAELIVQECVNGIKEWRDAADEHMDNEEYWKGYRSGCNDAIVEIIQRFGIEE